MRPRVRLDFAARLDWSDPALWRALAWSLPLSTLLGGVTFREAAGMGALWAVMLAALACAVTLAASAGVALALAQGSARGLTSFLAPSGGGTPSVDDWSYEKSLLARGRVDEALTALHARVADRPGDAALRLFAADVHARNAADPVKAERLFIQAREIPGASQAHDYQATSRLIDLYLGPLDDPARAAEELRRMRTRHAGTQGAAHAETALRSLGASR